MVFEALINPRKPLKHPSEMIAFGAFYGFLALVLAYWIFESNTGLVMVFFVVMAYIPFFYFAVKHEEEEDMKGLSETSLLKKHGKVIKLFVYFFVGVTISVTFSYVILPVSLSSEIFDIQQRTISDINSVVTAGIIGPGRLLPIIFLNNLRVLALCILFSLFYGFGALFILSWNASVIGVAAGNLVKSYISQYAHILGLERISVYFAAVSIGFFRYAVHGIPEIAAYFIGALAGGIISVAVIKRDFQKKNFQKLIVDSVDLLMIAIFMLFIAALLEVYVTPLII